MRGAIREDRPYRDPKPRHSDVIAPMSLLSMPVPEPRWKTRFPYLYELDLAITRIESSIHVVAAGINLAAIKGGKLSRFRMRCDYESVGDESS